MTGKKWMIVVTEEQYDWIKSVSNKTGLKGSDIVRELVDRCMTDDPKSFVNSLAATQHKMELEELERKQEAIKIMINEKKAAMKEKVAV